MGTKNDRISVDPRALHSAVICGKTIRDFYSLIVSYREHHTLRDMAHQREDFPGSFS